MGARRAALLAGALALAGCASVTSDPALWLNDLDCRDPSHLLAAGHTLSLTGLQGRLLVSIDQGQRWRDARLQPPPGDTSLRVLRLPDANALPALYASGFRQGATLGAQMASAGARTVGPWWRSADGGLSWAPAEPRVPLGPARGFGPPWPQVAFADGGRTWVVVSTGPEGVAVLRSTNGGQQWQRQALPGLEHAGPLSGDGRDALAWVGRTPVGFMKPSTFELHASDDAGAGWRVGPAPVGNAQLFRPAPGVLLAHNGDQLVPGRTLVFRSLDNGRTWARALDREASGRIASIGADADGRVVAITEFGHVLTSADAGATWAHRGQPVRDAARLHLARPVLFGPDGLVLALVGAGTPIRSTDGGATWQVADTGLPPKAGLAQWCLAGEGRVVALGGRLAAWSADRGATWVVSPHRLSPLPP